MRTSTWQKVVLTYRNDNWYEVMGLWRYLAIIPQVRMGYESIAHEAQGQIGYWLVGYEGERNNCFSKIQLVGQKYRD